MSANPWNARVLDVRGDGGTAGSRNATGGKCPSRAAAMAIFAGMVVVSAWMVPAASGHTVFKKQLERRYPGLVVKCEACHVKGKPKTETNDFGKLFNVEMASADLTAQWKAFEGIDKKKFELEVMKPAFLAALDRIKPLENPDGILWSDLLDTGKLPNTKLRKGVEKASEGAIPDDEVEEIPADDEDEEAADGESSGDPPADDESGEASDSGPENQDDSADGESGSENDGDTGSGGESGEDEESGGDGEPSGDSVPPSGESADQPKDTGGSGTPPDQPKDGGGGEQTV